MTDDPKTQMPENVEPGTPLGQPTPADAGPTESSAAENVPQLRRADRSRDRNRTLSIVGVVVASLVLVAVAVFMYQAIDQRRAAAAKLSQAIDLIETADAVVVQIDGVVREEVTPELAERARGAAGRVAGATEQLEEAVRLIDTAHPDLNDEEREQSALLKETAEARLEMLSHAPAILEYNAKAAEALAPAEQAWDLTLSADKLSDQSVAAYNKLTKAGVQQSSKLNKQAASQLASASALFEQAAIAFPEAGLDRYSAYVASRIKLNKLSQESDVAWLKGDLVKANTLIKTYNEEDKRAVALAKALPTSPRQAIAAAYESGSKEATDLYYDARERATKADESLREY